MKLISILTVAASLALAPAAFAQSSLSDGPVAGGKSGSEKPTTNHEAPVTSPTPSSEGSSSGATGSSSTPTSPQEKQDLRQSGEAPSAHNDPGTSTSPPSPDAK